jgi:ubiquinone/menaquinone biosynthesis C-methylase UbiE
MGYGIDAAINDSTDQNCIFMKGQLDHKIPIEDSIVDVITSLAVLEHIQHPATFVNEILRVLKPRGCCILTTPSPRAKPLLEFLACRRIISEQDIRDHKHYYTSNQLRCLLSEFTSVKISYFQFGFNTLVFAMK